MGEKILNHIIEVKNLTKDYGYSRGVFDVNIHVDEGEVFGFLGPNGAGKSTTIRHLMGFSKPDKGTTRILGFNSFNEYYKVLSNVGYIPGEIALPDGLTGYEFISMMQDLQKIHNDEKIAELIKLFELDDKALSMETKRMSLGIKRKLAIVTAFMSDPDVLILDEPTSGLDPIMQECFIDYIHKEKERGKTILLSSHIFSEIDNTCDRIAIIKDGRIVSEFDANELKHASNKKYIIKFKDDLDVDSFINKSKSLNTLHVINVIKKELYIALEDNELNELIDIISNLNIISFSNKKETLEDYFMKFYKEEKEFGGDL